MKPEDYERLCDQLAAVAKEHRVAVVMLSEMTSETSWEGIGQLERSLYETTRQILPDVLAAQAAVLVVTMARLVELQQKGKPGECDAN